MNTLSNNDVKTASNDKSNKEENTMNTEKLNSYISNMNDAINASKISNVKMFTVYETAYNKLKDNSKDYKTFKDGINLNNSTIRKMEKICQSAVISDNAISLPISWGTLYSISTMNGNDITDAITSGIFNPNTTKKQVSEYKKELKAKDAKKSKDKNNKNDATKTTVARTLESAFFSQIDSVFSTRKDVEIDDKGHKEIQKALKVLNKYIEITEKLDATPNFNDAK